MSTDPVIQKPRTPEEDEAANEAAKCVKDCYIEGLITESKFLHTESLQQLVKHIILGSNIEQLKYPQPIPDQNSEKNSRATSPSINSAILDNDEELEEKDEAMAIFFLEILVRITILNKDRVNEIWPSVEDHMKKIIEVAVEGVQKKPFLLERSVSGLLRMAVRLGKNEDLTSLVVRSLAILESLNTQAMFNVARHVAFGLYELLRNNAANIHETEDWNIIFMLVEMVGAGVTPTALCSDLDEDSGHGSAGTVSPTASSGVPVRERSGSVGSSSGGWIVLDKTNPDQNSDQTGSKKGNLIAYDPAAIAILQKQIVLHDSLAFLKCCESLAFLVRDVAHITPLNFTQCVQALRIFVEASFSGRIQSNSVEDNKLQAENGKNNQETTRSAMKHRTPAFSKPPSSMRKVRSAPHNVRMPLRQIQEPIPIMMPMSLTMKIFPVNFIMSHYNFWILCIPCTPGLPKFTFLGLKRLIIMALLGEPIQTTILSILQGYGAMPGAPCFKAWPDYAVIGEVIYEPVH